MMKKDDFSDIRALLALKRNELPSDNYFDSVLPEFHRRQRAELLQPRAPWMMWWNQFVESVSALMHETSVVRYAGAMAVIALVCAVGAIEMQKSAPADVAQTPEKPATLYAFNQALDPRYLSKIDQIVDAASVGSMNTGSAPHYVMAEMPAASSDATMAF